MDEEKQNGNGEENGEEKSEEETPTE